MMSDSDEMQRRLARLERRARTTTVFAILGTAIGLLGMAVATGERAVAAPPSPAQPAIVDLLRVRAIDVVDAKGTTRVKIAAPLPNAVIEGRKLTRGGKPEDTISGVLLFDADGVERSGYATVDRGYSNVMLTLDDKRQQHALFIAEPTGATTLRLFNGATRDRLDLSMDEDGPAITMTRRGQEIYRQPAR
jgi:hypothetical protein